MRLVFFGTPEFAVPTLEAVARAHDVALVVAQPDRPAGRGLKLQAPAAAVRARELGLPLAQPAKIRSAEFLDEIARRDADVGVVIAYGRILPASLLAIPRHGFVNVHASILPKYRGAAPIQRAIEAGERTTGVTIMRVDEELDHGPMLAVETTEIGPDERTPSLSRRLSELGARALLDVLDALARGAAAETPQDHASATLAPKIEKHEGEVRFDESAVAIYDRFRAFDPWPGIFVQSGAETIKLTEIRPVLGDGNGYVKGNVKGNGDGNGNGYGNGRDPRTILEIDDGVVVAAKGGAIRILEMQRPGKSRASASAVAHGLGWRAGQRLP